ncbi:MAG: hypothetical protein ACTSSF_11830 [Candidatus Heimdallarchaeaceae archaeon]
MKKWYSMVLIFALVTLPTLILFAEWREWTKEDLLTGTKKVYIATYAIAKDYSSLTENDPSLVIHLDYAKGLEIYVDWEEYIDSDSHHVLYRIDEDEISIAICPPSTNGGASFCPKIFNGMTIYDFLHSLKNANTITLRAIRYTKEEITAKFNLEGLEQKLEPYQKDLSYYETCYKLALVVCEIIHPYKKRVWSVQDIAEKHELSQKSVRNFSIKYKKTGSTASSQGVLNYYDIYIYYQSDYADEFAEKMSIDDLLKNIYSDGCLFILFSELPKYKYEITSDGKQIVFTIRNWTDK